MTDKTLTNNEIIKAFECCIKANGNCENCEIENFCKEHDSEINKETLDLINRLQAENERKDKIYIDLLKTSSERADIISSLYAENERLRQINDSFTDIGKLYSEIKAEAYKEFADLSIKRICEQVSAPTPSESYIVEKCNQTIDNLLKELVGEDNAST